MMGPAYRYLTLRSLGAPAVLMSLAMQGVFRGFRDTKTPLYATGMDVQSSHASCIFIYASQEPWNYDTISLFINISMFIQMT